MIGHGERAKKVLGSVGRAKQAMTLKDVTTGARVVVTAETIKEHLVAQTIDITPAPTK